MSLSDVCHDQVLAIVEARAARDRDLVIKGVRELIEDVDWYAEPHEIRYPGDQFDALRRAAQRVIDHPDDEDDLLWLLALAECVRRLYDYSLGEIDNWCALYLRGREDHFAGRCGECGAEDGEKRIRDRFGEMLNEMMNRYDRQAMANRTQTGSRRATARSPAAEEQARYRERLRRGVACVPLPVTRLIVDYLVRRGLLSRDREAPDRVEIGLAAAAALERAAGAG